MALGVRPSMNDAATRWHSYSLTDLTMSKVMRRQAARWGAKDYIRSVDGRRISYAEAHERTNRIANWLQGLGLTRGAHVAVMMESVPECLLAHIALAKLGIVSIPIN